MGMKYHFCFVVGMMIWFACVCLTTQIFHYVTLAIHYNCEYNRIILIHALVTIVSFVYHCCFVHFKWK